MRFAAGNAGFAGPALVGHSRTAGKLARTCGARTQRSSTRLRWGRPGAITWFAGDYRFLSNFYVGEPFDVEVRGRVVSARSGEHAYQASKPIHDANSTAILAATTPGEAKRLGRRAAIRDDWDAVSIAVMRRVIRAKFTAGSALAERLLATGHAVLVEGNTWNDRFWGVTDRGGENWLGYLLMARRSELHLAITERAFDLKEGNDER